MTRPIDPIKITLLDGQQREFLLSLGALRRAARAADLPIHRALVERPLEFAGAALYESMLDKGTMTQEQFEDLLHPADIGDSFQRIQEASAPISSPTAASLAKIPNGTG